MCLVCVCLVFVCKYVLGHSRVSQPLNLRLCLLWHLGFLTSPHASPNCRRRRLNSYRLLRRSTPGPFPSSNSATGRVLRSQASGGQNTHEGHCGHTGPPQRVRGSSGGDVQQKVRHARAACARTSAKGADAKSAQGRASASTNAEGANARSAGGRRRALNGPSGANGKP